MTHHDGQTDKLQHLKNNYHDHTDLERLLV